MADQTYLETSRDHVRTAALLSLVTAILGAAAYAWMVTVYHPAQNYPNFGQEIYDQYWLAIMDGRLDLPARVLRYEGHYTPEGVGFLYHGAAPLITRALAAPFIPIGSVNLAPYSIAFWAILGTAFYHLAFLAAARGAMRRQTENGVAENWSMAPFWAVVLGVTLWFGGVGVLLVANVSLYHEPIAVCFGLGAIFLWLWSRVLASGWPVAKILIGLAICAAIAVHARPHIAVALYLGTGLAILFALWQDRARAFAPALLALAVLGAGGGAYLGLNQLRFGDMSTGHGTFEAGATQYGPSYFGIEEADGRRGQTFTEHGAFNIGRVPYSAVLYGVAIPYTPWTEAVHDYMERTHLMLTEERYGFIRIERPDMGVLWMWAGFFVAAFAAFRAPRADFAAAAAPLLTSAIAAVFVLSYATITLRYRIDLWIALGPLVFLGVGVLAPRLASSKGSAGRIMALACLCGLAANLFIALLYTANFRSDWRFFADWTEEHCLEQAAGLSLSEAQIGSLCRPPLPPGGQAGGDAE
ncbi:MAG: hypothetical protein AAF871_12195 [Pseudomonadota bacterium]